MGGLAAILAALSILPASPVAGAAPVDCRYSSDEETTSSATVEQFGGLSPTFLPQNDVFRPILADQRELRFYADYRRVHFRAESCPSSQNRTRRFPASGSWVGVFAPGGCPDYFRKIPGPNFAFKCL